LEEEVFEWKWLVFRKITKPDSNSINTLDFKPGGLNTQDIYRGSKVQARQVEKP